MVDDNSPLGKRMVFGQWLINIWVSLNRNYISEHSYYEQKNVWRIYYKDRLTLGC